MIEGDFFTLDLYARRPISTCEVVESLVQLVVRLVGEIQLRFLFWDGRGAERAVPVGSATRHQIEEQLRKPGLNVEDAENAVVNLLVEPGKHFDAVHVQLADRVLETRSAFFDFVERVALLTEPDLLFVGRPWQNVSYRATDTAIADGLRDTYWINSFGSEYVELIGEKKLLRTPNAEVKKLPGDRSRILVKLSDRVDCDEERVAFRKYLGEDIFVPLTPQTEAINTGNPFRIVKHFWEITRKPPLEVAPRRPYFEGISEMIASDDPR